MKTTQYFLFDTIRRGSRAFVSHNENKDFQRTNLCPPTQIIGGGKAEVARVLLIASSIDAHDQWSDGGPRVVVGDKIVWSGGSTSDQTINIGTLRHSDPELYKWNDGGFQFHAKQRQENGFRPEWPDQWIARIWELKPAVAASALERFCVDIVSNTQPVGGPVIGGEEMMRVGIVLNIRREAA